MSDVDGLYTANPSTHPEATLIHHVSQIDTHVSAMASGSGSSIGTGGMATKLRAARAAMAAGIPTLVCRGRTPHILLDAVLGKEIGTRFESATANHEDSRKLWIGLAEPARGQITLDEGACKAVLEQGGSILPVGITQSEGSYAEGDVLSVFGPDGSLIGRGVSRYSSEDMIRVQGLRLEIIGRFLPEKASTPAIHRDELLVF